MFVGDGGSGSGEEVVPTGMCYEVCVVIAVGMGEGGNLGWGKGGTGKGEGGWQGVRIQE